MMEKKQEPDRLVPCAGKCGETFVNPWPNEYCHRCGAAVEGDGATIPDLRSELSAVKAENERIRREVFGIAEDLLCGADIACEHKGVTGLEGAIRLKAALTPPKAEKPSCPLCQGVRSRFSGRKLIRCECTEKPCPTPTMPGVPHEKGCEGEGPIGGTL